jgi:hypothetical protein
LTGDRMKEAQKEVSATPSTICSSKIIQACLIDTKRFA